MIPPQLASARLTVNLGALARNWRRLDAMTGPSETAAVVKANAYGLGIEQATPALWQAGCRTFFVAQANEGQRVLAGLPEADVFVLNGLMPGAAADYAEAGLMPVLNTMPQVIEWTTEGRRRGQALPCAVHIDTGMTRLGLLGADVEAIAADPRLLEGADVQVWLTHPACADQPGHALNDEQLALFRDRLAILPKARSSAANSPAIFLGPEWHFDLCRPGVALYGSTPSPLAELPMEEVIRLDARILQIHEVERWRNVGYGATQTVEQGSRIATCGVGYADGYIRSLSNVGYGVLAGRRVPLVGRVSMDLITFDISAVPPGDIGPDSEIAIIGGGVDLDELAALGGTIAYELLTGLGDRFTRAYVDGAGA
ncbi:MAG: alanine racemase [Minwuia sp.]|uniref:alanine racemase n=1 Tax=Minwuia sp. TaxID=2493630 RepID=UPI003A8C5225